jgi:hypothetical protein
MERQRKTTSRQRKKKPNARKLTKVEWRRVAQSLAWDAGENHWSKWRGMWFLEDVDAICSFNNYPYAELPAKRTAQVAAFRKRIKAAGIKELAHASYPPAGEEGAGNTFVLITEGAGEDQSNVVSDSWNEIVGRPFETSMG